MIKFLVLNIFSKFLYGNPAIGPSSQRSLSVDARLNASWFVLSNFAGDFLLQVITIILTGFAESFLSFQNNFLVSIGCYTSERS